MTAGFFLPHFVSPDFENLQAQFEQKQLPRYCWGAHGRNLAKIHGTVIGENDCDGNFGYNIKPPWIPVKWLTSVPILWGEVTYYQDCFSLPFLVTKEDWFSLFAY